MVDEHTHEMTPDAGVSVTFFSQEPMSSENFAAAFRASPRFERVLAALPAVDATPVAEMAPEAEEALLREFALSGWDQTKLLLHRELNLLRKDTASLRSRAGRFIIIGVILGALFLNLDLTIENGFYARPGLLFFSMVFLGMASFGELGTIIERRNVFYKHRDGNLHSALPYVTAMVCVDVPITGLEAFVFGVIVYFMSGLNLHDAGTHFCLFWLLLTFFKLALASFTRFISAIAKDLTTAQTYGAGIVVLWILFCGFLIPVDKIPPWFIWIHYMSPVAYAYEAIMYNEFDGLTFHSKTVPSAPPVSGLQLLSDNYGLSFDNQAVYRWAVVLVLFGYFLLFVVMSALALSYLSFGSEGNMLQYARKKMNAGRRFATQFRRLVRGVRQRLRPKTSHSTIVVEEDRAPLVYFSWDKLSYEVDMPTKRHAPAERKKLLNNVSGYVRSGMLVALMGASGAGKTTLLDVLARRKTGGYITGAVKLNGADQDDTFKRLSGYVEQQDIHTPRSTVREALVFAASLRLPASVTKEERDRLIAKTVVMLGLETVMDALIGAADLDFGLSSETRKRVTIAVELVTDPKILFMDEPTSGLDTAGAISVMRAARAVANSGKAVVCTIHQPSAEIFEVFDYLLLLQRGGETVYFGPIGAHSDTLTSYFVSKGAEPCDIKMNPADYILIQIGAGIGKTTTTNWAQTWRDSREAVGVDSVMSAPDTLPLNATPFYFDSDLSTSSTYQVRTVLARTFRTYWRTPSYNATRILFQIFMALLMGLSYLRLGHSQADLRQRVSVLYFTSVLGNVAMLNAIGPMMSERSVYYRETAGGAYGPYAYFSSSGTVELPFISLATIIFSAIIYWLVGFQTSQFGFFFLISLTFMLYCVTFGQAVAVLSPTAFVAQTMAPAVSSFLTLFTGFLITKENIPPYFIWIYYLNPMAYFLQAIVSNEMEGAEYDGCGVPGAPVPCYPTGESFLDFYGWSANDKWQNWGILLLFVGVFRVVTYLGIVYKKHISR